MNSARPTTATGVALRKVVDADLSFLRRVYAESRAEEMTHVADWTPAQKMAFLDQQFDAQHTYYHQHYPDADYDVIERDGAPVGRLYVFRGKQDIRLMDIALLADQRNHGIGGALTRELQNEGRRRKKIVSLHVEEHNPAKRLYERLGFEVVGEVTFYKRMHWAPSGLEALSRTLAAAAQAQVNTAS